METLNIITLLFAVITLIVGLIGNLFVIIATVKHKTLRTVTNTLLGTLAMYDILLVTICQPWSLFHTDEQQNFSGTTTLQTLLKWVDNCDIVQGLYEFGRLGHVLCMLLLAGDRLFYMLSYNKYKASASAKVYVAIVIGCTAVISAMYSGLAVSQSPQISFRQPCWFSTRIKPIFNEAIVVPILVLCLAAFLAFYVTFFYNCATKTAPIDDVMKTEQPQPMGASENNGSQGNQVATTGAAPQGGSHGNNSGGSNLTTCIINQSNSELQITWAIGICIALFIPSYLTSYIIFSLARENPLRYETWVYHVALWVNNVHMCINPVIVILVHSEFKNTLKRFILCKWKTTVHPAEALVLSNGDP